MFMLTEILDGRSPLQAVFDVLGVGPVESLQLLVEIHVPLVDVVNVIVWVVAAPPAINSMVTDLLKV